MQENCKRQRVALGISTCCPEDFNVLKFVFQRVADDGGEKYDFPLA